MNIWVLKPGEFAINKPVFLHFRISDKYCEILSGKAQGGSVRIDLLPVVLDIVDASNNR